MKISEIINLKSGDAVSYACYANLTFIGKDDQHVILMDKHGEKRKFYIELFEKYGKKEDEVES